MNGSRAVFAYGTLMFDRVMRAVSGEASPGIPAVLEGYARHVLHGRVYPGIVERPGSLIEGVLYEDIGPRALARLDDFEDDLYERRTLTVRVDGIERYAEAWVVPATEAHRLSDRPWDPEEFRSRHLPGFLALYGGARRILD